jgi:DNA-binding GntR family transcriptional regulator
MMDQSQVTGGITYVIDMDGAQSSALPFQPEGQPVGRGIYLSKSDFIASLLRELIISGDLKPGRLALLLALMRLLWQSFPQGPQVARPRDESVAEHKQLIEALRDRDAARAQAITQQHILGAIRYLEDELS